MSTLKDLLIAIRNDKKNNLISKNLKSGTYCLGVRGTLDFTQFEDYKICDALTNSITGIDNPINKLEYIETSGSQYINTDIKIDKTNKVIIKYRPLLLSGGQCLIGSINSNDLYYCAGWDRVSSNAGAIYLGVSHTVASNIKIEDVTVTFESDTIYYKSNSINTSYNQIFNDASIELMIFNNSQYNEKGSVRLYSIEIYDINNILIHNLLPAINILTNEVGLYDFVTNKMYLNSGSGDFIKGGLV